MSKKASGYHKRRMGLIYAILAVALIAASVVAACTVFFRVETVTVEGNERYSTEQILPVAGVEVGSNLILTPGDQIVQRICDALPYVDSVEVHKRFPTTLRLVIHEAQPVAVVHSNDQLWIIDSKGRLLELVDGALAVDYIDVEGMVLVDPVQGQPAQVAPEDQIQLDGLLGLLAALEEKDQIEPITEIDVSSKTEIVAVYEGRIKVKFLINADFARKIEVMKAIIAPMESWERGSLNLKGSERAFYSPDR